MSRELQNGMVAGFIAVGWMLLLFFLHQETSGMGLSDPYVCVVLLSAFIYITILRKRDTDLNGVLSIKDGITAGIVTAFMAGLMIGTFKMVYVKYINPGIVDQVVLQAESFYRTSGGTAAQIKNAGDSARVMYSSFGQFTYGIGITMLLGGIVSLVCSIIMRRDKKIGVNA